MWLQCSKCRNIRPWFKFSRGGSVKYNFGLHYYCNSCKNTKKKNPVTYSNYYNKLQKQREYYKAKKSRIVKWQDRDLLDAITIQDTEPIYFDLVDSRTAKSITIKWDVEDIEKFNKIKALYGTDHKRLIRMICRLFFLIYKI